MLPDDPLDLNYYNIPRKIRELQLYDVQTILLFIITYQEKLGNYNTAPVSNLLIFIITYQEKLGNYNTCTRHSAL